MGNSSSRSVSEVPLHDIGLDMKVKYNTEELTSYEAACHEDGDLRSFDADLHARTSHVISTLAEGVEVQALSFESFKEVTGCLLDMNQQVVKVILECKKDIWKNQELFNLVEDYLESSLQTLDFCSALNKCLKRARDAQLLIHVALQHFEEEDEIECGQTSSGRYMRTLEDLRHFKAAGDPFTEEFFVIFQSVYRQQVLMLQKLQIRRKKLDKKLRYIRTWRKVSSMIFMVTFTALLICSVVAAAVATPTVAAALAAAVPAGSMGKLVDQLWKKYENSVKGQKEVVTSMQVSTNVAIKDLEGIRALVDRLEVEIESLMKTAELATRGSEEEGGGGVVRLMVEDIGKKLSVFGKKVDELRVQADACGRDVRQARTVVLQRMIRNPTR